MKLEGVYTALVTPMMQDGKVDEKALRRLVDLQIEGGVQGLVPVGTTGESPTLDGEECKQVIRIVVEQARGRVPVIGGAGSNNTKEAIHYAREAKEVGASATLQVTPYYNKPTNDGILAHFRAIADAVDLPLVVYNIAGRTAKNIDTPTMLELAKHRNIVAVKEASGDIAQMMDLISRKPADFTVLSGDDNLVFPLMALGGRGVISVASNLVPDRMSSFVGTALKGDWEAARKMHYDLLPLFKAMFIETNPIPIKAALAMKGLISEIYRLPMCCMAAKNRDALAATLKDLKVL
ncbi:MAG TPA: 4-hydroxy-tetrahydrodipicolinate synthase [Spirochaetia bacterium]|nr:4-hydroxy-tetrahydrodipicolinate synthase [Spirochaetia bacterium]